LAPVLSEAYFAPVQTKKEMITKMENIGEHSFANGKSDSGSDKANGLRLSSSKANEKAKQLLRSIMSDFPTENETFTHNFD
jgi:hypothetical protein